MLYLKRKADIALENWLKDPNKKPLIIKGARQVGKSETIRHFGEQHYENIVEINFAIQPEFKQITNQGYSVDNVIRQISLLDSSLNFTPKKTLLFFDEIQDHPDIATSFKSFAQDGRFDVIGSGSMLGINYKAISSFPMGYVNYHTMRSLDFEEFLWACGYKQDFIEEIFSNIKGHEPFSQTVMYVMENKFMDYCLLGGMPEIVRNYFEKSSFEGSLEMQRQLMEEYKMDVRKYASGLDQARILNVLNSIPSQLAKENKKFQISKVAKKATFKDYRGCIEWLNDAGIINICHALHQPSLPIKGNYKPDVHKIYFSDTGLLIGQLDDESQRDLRVNKNFGTYKGALYENIVGEALVKAGFELAYYKKENATLEEDFFVRCSDDLVPIEVKSSNSQSKSLRTLITSDKYPQITWGIKFAKANIGFKDNILTLPYWSAFLIDRLVKNA